MVTGFVEAVIVRADVAGFLFLNWEERGIRYDLIVEPGFGDQRQWARRRIVHLADRGVERFARCLFVEVGPPAILLARRDGVAVRILDARRPEEPVGLIAGR